MKTSPLKKNYAERCVLDVPALELRPGEICAIIGANGSGKSTLAKILAGLEQGDGGAKAFEEKPDIGYMPQKSYAFRMKVLDNIRLGGGSVAEAMDMLEKLGIAHLAKSPGKKLSGGESARMALGRVLMRRRELVILDEPSASMDMESTSISEKLIVDYCRQRGAAVLWVTHSLAQARRVADKIIFLSKGRLVEFGDAEAVLENPQMPETKEFLKFYE